MKYYAVQVKTKSEENFLKNTRRKFQNQNIYEKTETKLVWPRRELTIRRKGVSVKNLAPIFPGYVFLGAEEFIPEIYWLIKGVDGFGKFLKNNTNIEPLSRTDTELLLHFLSYGEVVRESKAVFDENQRIQILDGPMKGLEGDIIKVDKRKGRAKVHLTLYENSFLIDFGFTVLAPVRNSEEK